MEGALNKEVVEEVREGNLSNKGRSIGRWAKIHFEEVLDRRYGKV